MLRCSLASVLLFVAVVYGQNCNQDTDKYRQCLQQVKQQQQDAMAKEREASQAKMKDQVKQCFTSSGCKEPNFDQPSKGKGEGKGGWGKGGSGKGQGGGADFEKKRQCSKQIEDKARATIEKCVQAKQPDFKFPAPDNKNQQKGGGMGGHGGGRGGFGNINESCPTDDSRQKVKTCMRDSFQKGGSGKGGSGDDRRQQGEARFNQSCQARDACFKAMSPQCQTQFNTTKKTTCDCAQQLLTSSKTQLDQEYNTCAGTSTVTTPSPSQGNGRGHFGGFGQQRGSNLEMFVKRMCSDRDFCHGGFGKGGGGHGGGHFGGGHFGGGRGGGGHH